MSVPDQLSGGRDRSHRRVGRRTLVAASLVVVALAGADRWQLARERAALVSCVEQGQGEVVYADRRIAATTQYASPALTGTQTPPGVRRSLRQIVQRVAGDAVAPTVAAAAACRRPLVLPWHGVQRSARDRYATYLSGEADRLRSGSRDLDALSAPPASLELSQRSALAAVLTASSGPQADRLRALLSP